VLPPRRLIESAARRFAELAPASAATGVAVQARLAAENLARMLLGPSLGDIVEAHRLLVAADGALLSVPFAALPIPRLMRVAGGGDGGPLLIDNYEVISIPSASLAAWVAQEAEAGTERPHRTVAVVADPVFTSRDPRLARSQSAPSARSPLPVDLPRLPGALREGQAILAMAGPGDHLAAFGFDARRDRVMAGELVPHRIIHFATHGLYDSEHPELSGLMLSQWNRSGQPVEGFLATHDIATLQLSADLVVLSACRTALGRELPGEGLSGLAQAFLIAGARQVMVSLWQVEDRTTAELMEHFYRALLERGELPEAALVRAQRLLRSGASSRASAHWAGFVLFGVPLV
jgi:CHAT domain-containing protein